MKPSELDDCVLDGELELEEDLPYRGAIEVNRPIIDIMVDLGDNDEWLPWNEWRKVDNRITDKPFH
jgi:hypothetical protein